MYAIRSQDDPSYFYDKDSDEFTTNTDERTLYETEDLAKVDCEERFKHDPELTLEVVWIP